MERAKLFAGSSNTSPVPVFLNDQLIEDSIGLSRNCDNDLLFQQLPLPEQLLQSDEKDGEDDSSNNSMNEVHRRELDCINLDLSGSAAAAADDDQEQQDQIKVSFTRKFHCNFLKYFYVTHQNRNRNETNTHLTVIIFRRRKLAVNVNHHYQQRITEFCPVSII